MMNYDEIKITKCKTEFVAKHKDYDVIGVGGNEFEAVLELSKALGALMFSKDVKAKKEHELLGLKNKMINAYQAYLASEHTHDRVMIDKWKNEIFRLQNEVYTLEKEIEEMK